jgi:Chromo (CHRromatin Organisation MOdifier) domain
MLRAYVNPHHNDWDQHLTAVEFAYNNSKQASTGYTPFQLNYGQHPHIPATLAVPEGDEPVRSYNDAAQTMMQSIADQLKHARTSLESAQERQTLYANTKRREHLFTAGDQVLIKGTFLSNLPSVVAAEGSTQKLAARGWGPFKVLEVVHPNAVRLELPTTWKINPVLNTSYLTPWRDGTVQYPDRQLPPPDPEIVEEEEHYHVEAFRKHRWYRGNLQYLVKWTGHNEENNTWNYASQLAEDMDKKTMNKLVEQYRRSANLPRTFSTRS